MKFRIQVVRVADDGAEQMKEVMEFERQELAMETLGMSLAEGKAVLKGVLQEFVAEQQAAEFLQRSGLAGIARGICRAKAPVRLQCARCSGQCGYQTHAGISATVSRPGKGPFDRSKAGCVLGKPVLSCRRESHGLKQANASSHRIATWSLVAAAVALAASIYAILTHVLH